MRFKSKTLSPPPHPHGYRVFGWVLVTAEPPDLMKGTVFQGVCRYHKHAIMYYAGSVACVSNKIRDNAMLHRQIKPDPAAAAPGPTHNCPPLPAAPLTYVSIAIVFVTLVCAIIIDLFQANKTLRPLVWHGRWMGPAPKRLCPSLARRLGQLASYHNSPRSRLGANFPAWEMTSVAWSKLF